MTQLMYAWIFNKFTNVKVKKWTTTTEDIVCLQKKEKKKNSNKPLDKNSVEHCLNDSLNEI